jgi:hypothetical protein
MSTQTVQIEIDRQDILKTFIERALKKRLVELLAGAEELLKRVASLTEGKDQPGAGSRR